MKILLIKISNIKKETHPFLLHHKSCIFINNIPLMWQIIQQLPQPINTMTINSSAISEAFVAFDNEMD
jgi:hypothetical protein